MYLKSKIVDYLWPKNRFPLLRYIVYSILILYRLPHFWLWSLFSNLRFGKFRWIRLDYGNLFVRSNDFRAFSLARTHGTQKKTVTIWRNMSILKPDLIVDVGANYGEFTIASATMQIPSLAVEANPIIADCLKTSFTGSQCISIFDAALSDSDGSRFFYVSPRYSGISSFSDSILEKNFFWSRRWQINKIEVKTMRLDSLVKNHIKVKPKSVILKIDVEGFELDVFRGALPLLEQCDWWRMILEFHPDWIKKTNGNVKEVWKAYRNNLGAIIGTKTISLEEILILGDNLPVEPPSQGCDLIIGQGYISNKLPPPMT